MDKMKPILKAAVRMAISAAIIVKAHSFVKTHSRFQKPFNKQDKRYGLLGDLVEDWKDRYFDFAWHNGYDEGFACGISASQEEIEEFHKDFEAREASQPVVA